MTQDKIERGAICMGRIQRSLKYPGNMDPAFLFRTDPVLGRHLVARRQLSPGTLVLQQQPYAAVLYDDQAALRCDYCYRTASGGQPLLRCARSKLARYCSRGHQAAAWRERGYQNECRALLACAERRQRGRGGGVPTATVRLAARALWRRIKWVIQYRYFSACSTLRRGVCMSLKLPLLPCSLVLMCTPPSCAAAAHQNQTRVSSPTHLRPRLEQGRCGTRFRRWAQQMDCSAGVAATLVQPGR